MRGVSIKQRVRKRHILKPVLSPQIRNMGTQKQKVIMLPIKKVFENGFNINGLIIVLQAPTTFQRVPSQILYKEETRS
jgi:hypothetical protein